MNQAQKQRINEAIILAGGKGSRLQSVVNDRPKPMAKIADRPFLEYLLRYLKDQGIRTAVICTGYKEEMIREYFADGVKFGIQIKYSNEEFPLGTAGAVRKALNSLSGERFLVLNGDSYCEFDIDEMLGIHLSSSALATICLVNSDDCSRYGSVEIDVQGMILSFNEKSSNCRSGLINAGVYILERKLIERIEKGKMISLEKDIFPNILRGALSSCRIKSGIFIDIGTPESYASSQEILKQSLIFTHEKRI